MCLPLLAAAPAAMGALGGGMGTALTMVSTLAGVAAPIMGYMGQQKAHKAQMQQYNRNIELANEAAEQKYGAAQNHYASIADRAADDRAEVRTKAIKARSTSIAGAENISGISVNNLINDHFLQEKQYNARLDSNLQTQRQAVGDEMKGDYQTAQSRINSLERPQPPSFAAAAIRAVGAGASGLGNMVSQQAQYATIGNGGWGASTVRS